MKKSTSPLLGITLAGVLALLSTSAHADSFGSGGNAFVVPFVPIGNVGNAADTTTYGAVSSSFNMSTYAISQAQINLAVTNGFTNGTVGSWTGSQPAASITWYQAAAFVNWLNTSTGHPLAYNLNAGATALTLWTPSDAGYDATNLFRNSNAYYFLPSENQYYKAAYYDPNKAGGAGYWQYATGSNTAPTAVASGTAAGTAVYGGGAVVAPAAVDQSGGLSPYGTMGQTGNVFEWMESATDGVNDVSSENRAIRGGGWTNPASVLQSSLRLNDPPATTFSNFGFRVASVPEPSSTVLAIAPCLMFLARRRRARSL